MKKNISFFIIALLGLSTLYAQTNLVQSFEELNNNHEIGMGYSGLAVMDLNHDGYDDLVLGACKYDNYKGRVLVYYGGTGVDNTEDFYLDGENVHDEFGKIIINGGDLNDDGYQDLIIAAPEYNNSKGRVYVYLGGPSMDKVPDLVIDNTDDMINIGYHLAGGSDVNNDGYDDFLIGCENFGDSVYGKVFLYLGGPTLSSTPGKTFTGTMGNEIGFIVAMAGDVNKDGYGDILIGDYVNTDHTGLVKLYNGGASISDTPVLTFYGDGPNSEFGSAIAGNMDMNGDGYVDIAISSPGENNEGGCVYIFFGSSSMDNTPDLLIESNVDNMLLGTVLANGGRLNNDAYDDLLIGAYGTNIEGHVYVYYGGSDMDNISDLSFTGSQMFAELGFSMAGNGDLNNDGYGDFAFTIGFDYTDCSCQVYWGGPAIDEITDLTISGQSQMVSMNDNYFGCVVAGAGDVNNDGNDDIMVSASDYLNDQGDNVGRVYLYYGGPAMDNTADLIFTGTEDYGKFGSSLASAGDVNNDNYDDILIGAYDEANNGRVYLYLGGAAMDNTPDVVMTGESSGDEFGNALAGVGDVNSDGYDDFCIGAQHKSKIYLFLGGETINSTADLTDLKMTNTGFGTAISGGGDFNNDGYDDIIAGACKYSSNTGVVYIYYGGPTPDLTTDLTVTHMPSGDYFGTAVSMVGDVNNDDYDDFLATVSRPMSENKAVYLYLGNNSGDVYDDVIFSIKATMYAPISIGYAGDLNGDNYDDIIIGNAAYNNLTGKTFIFLGGETVDNVADVIINGVDEQDEFAKSVTGVGDVDNDGVNDFLIGAPGIDYNGYSYIYNLDQNLASTGVKVFLQGAYDADAADPVMTTDLESVIPTTSPYSDSRTVSAIPGDVTDWVWLELRETETGAAVYGCSYFLRSDGCLVDNDTSSTILDLSSQVAPGDYYMVLKHRNHLGVISSAQQTISSSMATYDFTDAVTKYGGDNAAGLETGVFGMYAGNSDGNSVVTNADKDPVNANMDATGYENGDTNMDGLVTSADKDYTNTNMDIATSVNN